jgi:hypothetical protein
VSLPAVISIAHGFRLFSLAKSGSACFELYGDRVRYWAEEENTMKSRAKNEVKSKVEFEERLERPMTDPTLEGKDDSKVGRVQEKIDPVNWEALLTNRFYEKTVTEHPTDRTIFRQGQPADSYLRRGREVTAIPQGQRPSPFWLRLSSSARMLADSGCASHQQSR